MVCLLSIPLEILNEVLKILIQNTLSKVLNVALNYPAWPQASLPVHFGWSWSPQNFRYQRSNISVFGS